jgi:hypothetical protein
MPWKQEWVEPEIAFAIGEDGESPKNLIVVYHSYKDNWYHERYQYWFNLSNNDDEQYEFDIRDVPRNELCEPTETSEHFLAECNEVLIAFLEIDNYFERVLNGHSIDDLISHYEKNHRNFGCSE